MRTILDVILGVVLAVTALIVWLMAAVIAIGQSTQFFSTADPMTGHVTTGTVQTHPDGSQSYMWNDSTGRSKTDTGYMSPPIGGTRNFSIYDGDTGHSSVGSIFTPPVPESQPWLPFAPTTEQLSHDRAP